MTKDPVYHVLDLLLGAEPETKRQKAILREFNNSLDEVFGDSDRNTALRQRRFDSELRIIVPSTLRKLRDANGSHLLLNGRLVAGTDPLLDRMQDHPEYTELVTTVREAAPDRPDVQHQLFLEHLVGPGSPFLPRNRSEYQERVAELELFRSQALLSANLYDKYLNGLPQAQRYGAGRVFPHDGMCMVGQFGMAVLSEILHRSQDILWIDPSRGPALGAQILATHQRRVNELAGPSDVPLVERVTIGSVDVLGATDSINRYVTHRSPSFLAPRSHTDSKKRLDPPLRPVLESIGAGEAFEREYDVAVFLDTPLVHRYQGFVRRFRPAKVLENVNAARVYHVTPSGIVVH